MFADACVVVFGIRPIDDDKLILDAAVQFGAYIKTFKRLDLATKWHLNFVETMVKVKVDALSKRIIQKYGTHQEYLDRMRRRSGQSGSSYQRDSVREGSGTKESNTGPGCSDASTKDKDGNS